MNYLEIYYIDDKGMVRYTSLGAEGIDNEWAIESFNNSKKFEVKKEEAKFVLDLMNDEDDILDSIYIDNTGFTAITGETPKTNQEYINFDKQYWEKQYKRYTEGQKSQ